MYSATHESIEVWTSGILQHTPLLISVGLNQQRNYIKLHYNRYYLYIDSGMTQHETAASRTFLKVTLQVLPLPVGRGKKIRTM